LFPLLGETLVKNAKPKFTSRLIATVVTKAETAHKARVVTFASQFDNPTQRLSPGGMCSCCGAGPRVDALGDWWLVFRAGLCDSDGEFYAMLCDGPTGEGCLSTIRAENARRKPTQRDRNADVVRMLSGDDVDGMEADMDDVGWIGCED
jgi:hypothetical protein